MITTDAPVRQDGRLVPGDPARFAAQLQSALPEGAAVTLRIAAVGTEGPEVLAVPMTVDGLLLSVTLTAEQVAEVVGDAAYGWASYRITAGSGDALVSLFAGSLRLVSRWEGVAQGALLAGVSEAQAARISASAAEAAREAADGSADDAAGSAAAAAASAQGAAGSASTAATAATAAAQAAVAPISAVLDGRLSEASLSSTYARAAFAGQVKGLVEKLRTGQPTKWLIHTSSIMSGYMVSGSAVEGTYQADVAGAGRRVVAAIAAKYGNGASTVVVSGSAGATTRRLLGGGEANGHIAALAARIAQDAPDVVLLNLSTNDATVDQTPEAEYEANWRQIVREARKFGVAVIVVPPFEHTTPATDGALYATHKATFRRAMALEGVQPLAIERTLEDPANPGNALAGTTVDGSHPNPTGATALGAAAAAYFPTAAELATITPAGGRIPAGTWADPSQRGGHSEWVTADGATRRSRVQPIADADGFSILAPPAVAATLRMRGSLACYDMLQGTNAAVLYDKSGHGNDGTVSGATWGAAGLAFDGVNDYCRIPLDALGRLKVTPGRGWFSVRVAFKANSAGATQNIVTRRGDASTAPFALFLNGGKYNLIERGNTVDLGVTPPTATYEDVIVAWSLWDNRVRFFRNGTYVGEWTMAGGLALISGDPAWDWLIGTRFVGTDPATATPTGVFLNGTVAWVDLARSYVAPSGTEAADLHTALAAQLAGRGITFTA